MSFAKSYLSMEEERGRQAKKQAIIQEEEKRVQALRDEVKKEREELEKVKIQIEKLVKDTDQLEKKKIKQLAKIYGAMRAEESAPILLTLNDAMVAQIIQNIGDERTKGKLMAQIGNINQKRASSLTKTLASLKKKK